MSVQTRKNAELFYKALEDIWAAEQVYKGSPNIAVWLCTQATEKTMKGFLRCFGKEYGYDHNLEELLDAVNNLVKLPLEINENVLNLNRYMGRLRYRNMPTDPTIEDAQLAISRAKTIIDDFAKKPDVSGYIKEAQEIHLKILKSIT